MMRKRNSGSLPTHGGGANYGGDDGGYSGGGYSGGEGGYSTYPNATYSYGGGSNSLGSVSLSENEDKYHKPKSSSSLSSSLSAFVSKILNSNHDPLSMLCLALAFLALVTTLLWWNASSTTRGLLNSLEIDRLEEIKSMIEQQQKSLDLAKRQTSQTDRGTRLEYSTSINEKKKTQQELQRERDELKRKYEGPDRKEQQKRVLEREMAYRHQIKLLKKATQRESKRTVLERFGPGPHKVQMTFEYPPPSNNNKSSNKRTKKKNKKPIPAEMEGKPKEYNIVIDLAPLDVVPHAIHLFLEQVEHGLWNDTSFYLLGDHIIQGGPKVSREEVESNNTRTSMYAFQEVGLDSLSFSEYSDDYPHTEWTVGFAGRPGGPDIYINLDDNTENHGPGGQQQHTLSEYGDACFGEIVSGREFIESYLLLHEVYDDGTEWGRYYKEPVTITGAVVLTKTNQEGGEGDDGVKDLLKKNFDIDTSNDNVVIPHSDTALGMTMVMEMLLEPDLLDESSKELDEGEDTNGH